MLLSLTWYWQTDDLIDSLQVIYFKVSPVNAGKKWCSFFKWLNSSHIYFQQQDQRPELLPCPELGVDFLAPGRPALSDCCLPRWSLAVWHCVTRSNGCVVREGDTLTEAMTKVAGGRRVLSVCSRVPVGHPDGPLHQLPDTLPERGTPDAGCDSLHHLATVLSLSLYSHHLLHFSAERVVPIPWPSTCHVTGFVQWNIRGWDTSEACIKCCLENTPRAAWNRATWNRTVSPVLLAKTSLCQPVPSPAPNM